MDLWNCDEPIVDLGAGVDVPAWIEQSVSPCTVAAIVQGGCESGAYMPAVTYVQALETMNEHGDDVLQYIEDAYGELPAVPDGTSWAGRACFYLSVAVELWASGAESVLEDFEPEGEE